MHFLYLCLQNIYLLCRAADIDTLRILVATDCHVGYLESDEVRRYDSFNAFEEICSIASQRQVWGFDPFDWHFRPYDEMDIRISLYLCKTNVDDTICSLLSFLIQYGDCDFSEISTELP